MKQSISAGGGGGLCRIPTVGEVEVAEILLSLPKIVAKSELLSRHTFTWGRKKKRSVLVTKSESSPSSHRQIDEKLTVLESDKSPSTPLCFLPNGSSSGSDGVDVPKRPPHLKKKRVLSTTEDLKNKVNQMAQERAILTRQIKTKKNHNQQLRAQNLQLNAIKKEIYYSRNTEDFQLWNKSLDHNHYHQQIQMFAPPPPSPPPLPPRHCQQFMVDPGDGKVVAMTCSGNSNSGGRLGLFNHIDPRVNINGETFDFAASSQPLNQNSYMVKDNDLRARIAAAARQRRIMRMKENRSSLLAMKLSRGGR